MLVLDPNTKSQRSSRTLLSASEPVSNHPEKSGGLEKLTLLIVDDEEGPRQSLRIVFKNEYNTVVASSGLEAINIARKQPIHVAVLDILMQGMSGVELLRELKEIDLKIEVVMLTAYETIETARQALRHGASDYLNKPFDIPTMRDAVARAAAKHRTAAASSETIGELERLQREIQDQRVKEEMARTTGEIYASVLHDINSPLTIISGFVDLINRSMHSAARVEGQQLENLRGDLKQLTGQVDRCFEISRRYLTFLNRGAAESTQTSARQILIDLNDLLLRHPSAHGHQLIVHDLEEDIIGEINGTDFLQIALNLTINALQATSHPHRVEVRARRVDHAIDTTGLVDTPTERFINFDGFTNRAPLLALSVRDSGPGIPPEVMSRMFREIFTTKAVGQGTGLGLSIVRRLVREANGALHVQTTPGEGAEFTVLLQAL